MNAGVDERIEATRARRQRAERWGAAVSVATLALTLGAIGFYGRFGRNDRDAPFLGIVLLLMAVGSLAPTVWPNRHDEWHRRHLLHVAACALAAVVAWHVGEVVWQLVVDDGYESRPAKALNMVAVGTLIGHSLLRFRAESGLGEDE